VLNSRQERLQIKRFRELDVILVCYVYVDISKRALLGSAMNTLSSLL